MIAGRTAAVVAQRRKEEEDRKSQQGKSKHEEESFDELENLADDYLIPKGLSSEGYSNPLLLQYLKLARVCYEIVLGDAFNLFIIVVIIAAGVVVGLQSYPDLEHDSTVVATDFIILGIFCLEVLLKIAAEGTRPWMYWFGKEWRWNNFDFVIVVLCLPIWGDLFDGSAVALLRLMRLMRVMKLIKKIPQLQMIVMGLLGGIKSIVYILLLLFYFFILVRYHVHSLVPRMGQVAFSRLVHVPANAISHGYYRGLDRCFLHQLLRLMLRQV